MHAHRLALYFIIFTIFIHHLFLFLALIVFNRFDSHHCVGFVPEQVLTPITVPSNPILNYSSCALLSILALFALFVVQCGPYYFENVSFSRNCSAEFIIGNGIISHGFSPFLIFFLFTLHSLFVLFSLFLL
jgi:hypothetical protein